MLPLDIVSAFNSALSFVLPVIPYLLAFAVACYILRYMLDHGMDLDGNRIKPDVLLDNARNAAYKEWESRKTEFPAPMLAQSYNAQAIHSHRCPYCGGNPGKRYSCRNCGAPNFWADTGKAR